MTPPTRLQPSALASQRKAGEPNFSPSNRLQATGENSPTCSRGPTCRRRTKPCLITLYTLVVLMDLGLDAASKQARKMIDRVDKRLVFTRLNSRPFLHGETEPCINGRILGIGAYFKEPNDALANQLLSEQLEDGGWNCEAQEESPKR